MTEYIPNLDMTPLDFAYKRKEAMEEYERFKKYSLENGLITEEKASFGDIRDPIHKFAVYILMKIEYQKKQGAER